MIRGDDPVAVSVAVPVRVADVGGWTDTSFGAPGRVCNVAVTPGVSVDATFHRDETRAGVDVHLVAPDIGLDQRLGPDPRHGWRRPVPLLDDLLGHAVGQASETWPLPAGRVTVRVTSAVPAAASLGTSASVVVAVLGALAHLATGALPDPGHLAAAAFEVESARAGRACGVQDQWAAAHGGAAELAIDPFPTVQRHEITLDDEIRTALEDRVVTVVFAPHDSSAMHRQVIAALGRDPSGGHRAVLAALRDVAGRAADALRAGDLDAWAATLIEATDVQRRLHPALVGDAHQQAIDLVETRGASGWKVNGAGGGGGSLTVVARDPAQREDLETELRARGGGRVLLRHRIAAGIVVTSR